MGRVTEDGSVCLPVKGERSLQKRLAVGGQAGLHNLGERKSDLNRERDKGIRSLVRMFTEILWETF